MTEESIAKLPPELQDLVRKQAAEMAAAGAATEEQMRDEKVPTFDTAAEVAEYIRKLVERPHDYGTCVHAASMAAVAAMRYVARALGLTGFQVSCAELDVLRRVRGLEWGCVQNFEELLYPQYEHKFKGWHMLLAEHRVELGKRAAAKLAAGPGGHPDVRRHWEKLVKAGEEGSDG